MNMNRGRGCVPTTEEVWAAMGVDVDYEVRASLREGKEDWATGNIWSLLACLTKGAPWCWYFSGKTSGGRGPELC